MITQLIANYQLSQIKFESTNQIKMLYILVEETLRTELNFCKVRSITNNGVGRI